MAQIIANIRGCIQYMQLWPYRTVPNSLLTKKSSERNMIGVNKKEKRWHWAALLVLRMFTTTFTLFEHDVNSIGHVPPLAALMVLIFCARIRTV